LPIFQPILEAVWAEHIAPKAPLNGPSPETKRLIVDIPIDYASGSRLAAGNSAAVGGGSGGFIEHFRREADGHVEDTQYQLVSQEDAYTASGYQANDNQQWSWGNFFGGQNYNGQWGTRSYYTNQGWQQQQQQQQSRGIFGFFQPWTQQPPPQPQPRRYQGDQGYPSGGRVN
jgi:hypothetical protein